MPEMTGLELLCRLKSLGITWPVIVMTGQADVPIAIEAIKSGAVDFIEKPYDADAMFGAVRFALSGEASDMSGGFWRPSSMGAPTGRSRLTSASMGT
jgi:two-component system, LuxR family, response regulator FixJ